MKRLSWIAKFLLVALLLPACAQKAADSPQAVAERFYDYYLEQHMNNGLPSIEQTRQLGTMLSHGLQDAIAHARREQDLFIGEHKGEKPPWIEGDLFSSLFEGASAYGIGKVDRTDDHADVLVTLTFRNPKGRDVQWTDRLVLVRENSAWVVDDLEYGGNWDFANHGSLRRSLGPTEAATPASSH